VLRHSKTETLIAREDAFNHSQENEYLFLEAMRENFTHHFEGCEQYRKLCARENFTPEKLKKPEDIPLIPHIFVGVFKKRHLKSVPDSQIKLILRSSGTSGETSANYLDAPSLRRIKKIVWNIYRNFKMADKKESVNYLCFTHDPAHAKDLGTAFSDKLLSSLTSVNRIFFAIKYDKKIKDFYLDKNGCWRVLEEYARESLPIRILGFPSFLFEVISEYCQKTKKCFRFGKRSFIITGGGWKTLADREIPRNEFKSLIEKWLGIPAANVRDLYGLVEHGVPYCECEAGNLHIPIYSRVYAREPGTLKILKHGQAGLLHLLTPYLNSFPALSLLTSDIGKVYERCPCGRNAPYLVILGRGGIKKHKGCAISALDILKKAV